MKAPFGLLLVILLGALVTLRLDTATAQELPVDSGNFSCSVESSTQSDWDYANQVAATLTGPCRVYCYRTATIIPIFLCDGGAFWGCSCPVDPNGFRALAEYDKPEKGGNNDLEIDCNDAIFSSLRLWQDTNHDGFSQTNELHTLLELNVEAISLDFKPSRHTDNHGNKFAYRAKVYGVRRQDLGTWAYDVFLARKS